MSRPVHFEIHGEDPDRATVFYSEAFGWKAEKWGDQPYWLYSTGDGPGIDGAAALPQDHGQKVVLTIDVEDLDATVAKARAAGGQVILERHPIPGVGWLAQVLDPNGVLLGIMEADEAAG